MKKLREAYRDRLWEAKLKRVRIMDAWDLGRSAAVFAPHPDDETLGCGGLIYRKIRAGARVDVVFMTDGSRSHAAYMPESELTARRIREAQGALAILGVGPDQAHFLNFKDKEVERNKEEAGKQVRTLLRQMRPEQVYIPFHKEPPADHTATSRIVRGSLQAEGLSTRVFEYPIWFWHHWPWVRIPANLGRRNRELVRRTVRFFLGLRFLTDFPVALPLEDGRAPKRRALEQYESQMKRLIPGTSWPILADVAGGDFLDCFFTGWEIFST